MNVLRNILVVSIATCLLFITGCQGFIGLHKDIGDYGRGVENFLKPFEEGRQRSVTKEAAKIVMKNENRKPIR